MLIRLGYDIQFQIPTTVAMVALLSVHPSRASDLLEPDEIKTEPELKVTHYIDSFGNRCSRFVAPPGLLRLSGSTLIRDSDDVAIQRMVKHRQLRDEDSRRLKWELLFPLLQHRTVLSLLVDILVQPRPAFLDCNARGWWKLDLNWVDLANSLVLRFHPSF
jgi:hypothetical protein